MLYIFLRADMCIPSGIVGWWPGDEVATDIHGGNNATLQSGATYADGKIGKAFSFDGIDDFVAVPGAYGDNCEVTVAAWVKTRAETNDFQAIVSSAQENFVHLQLHNADWVGSRHNVIVFYTDVGRIDLRIVPQIPLGIWRHIALSAKSGASRVYVDGNSHDWVGTRFTTITPTLSLRIGAGFGYARFFNGEIDDVRIYNRALSQDEIKAIMEGRQVE